MPEPSTATVFAFEFDLTIYATYKAQAGANDTPAPPCP
jgi:hypothetical protein